MLKMPKMGIIGMLGSMFPTDERKAALAIGSLSCTLPAFLVVVGSSLASEGFADSLAQFVWYALGMGSILVAVTIGAALFRGAVDR